MQSYSPFFETLHDESAPTGNLGRGTHYSVLRAIVFHDARLRPISPAANMDFAVIWDEDHDTRIIEAIERIYRRGLLSAFPIVGEKKGCLNVVLSDEVQAPNLVQRLEQEIEQVAQSKLYGDTWFPTVSRVETAAGNVIADHASRVTLYLKNLQMLWALGVKQPTARPDLNVEVDESLL